MTKKDIKLVNDVVRKIGLTRGQREMLHRVIHGKGLTHREIEEEAKTIKEDYPRK